MYYIDFGKVGPLKYGAKVVTPDSGEYEKSDSKDSSDKFVLKSKATGNEFEILKWSFNMNVTEGHIKKLD